MTGLYQWLLNLLLLVVATASVIDAQEDEHGSWKDAWSEGSYRDLLRSSDRDPFDNRTLLRGGGDIILEGNGIMRMIGSPRLYVENNNEYGWDNIDMQVEMKVENTGGIDPAYALVARSNHDQYSEDPCKALSYYARWYPATGRIFVQKEYYHGNYTVYSTYNPIYYWEQGIPHDTWMGIRFKVTTLLNSTVLLEMYVDEALDQNWNLIYSLLDEPGVLPVRSGPLIPDSCPQKSGDPIVRPSQACFFRSDGNAETVTLWRKASIQNSPAEKVISICFPRDATVYEKKKGTIEMHELQIGDHVLVRPGIYERIYSFGHYDLTSQDIPYLKITTTHNTASPLVISRNHMVFATNLKEAVPARTLTRGDTILTKEGSAIIETIESVTRTGALAPFTTPSGMLMVNDFLVSSFVSLQQDGGGGELHVAGIPTGLTHHWIANSFCLPRRLYCFWMMGECQKETYDKNGVASWLAKPLQFAQCWTRLSAVGQIVMAIPLLIWMFMLWLCQLGIQFCTLLL